MSCRVIKWRKGVYAYVYEQESKRDSEGRVVTKHLRYLGPLNPMNDPKHFNKNQRKKQDAGESEEVEDEATISEQEQEERKQKVDWSLTNGLRKKISLRKYQVREERVVYVQRYLESVVKNKGWGDMGNITIKRGVGILSHKKRRDGYVVYIPRKKNAATGHKIAKEIYRAQSRTVLDAMQKNDPKRFERVKAQFTTAQKARDRALSKWWMKTDSDRRMTRSIATRVGHKGQFGFLAGQASKYGLSDKSKRFKKWEEEFSQIQANFSAKGCEEYRNELRRAYSRAQAQVKYYENPDARALKSKKAKGSVKTEKKYWKKSRKKVKRLGVKVHRTNRVWKRGKRKLSHRRRMKELGKAQARFEATKRMYSMAKVVEETSFPRDI